MSERQFLSGGAPAAAVKVAVAHGLAHMVGLYLRASFKVGYGSGHFQNAVIGSRAHVIARHRRSKHRHRFRS